jgi:hypothetical protein
MRQHERVTSGVLRATRHTIPRAVVGRDDRGIRERIAMARRPLFLS